MSNRNEQAHSGFWFGIVMGSIVGSGALYFLGTEKGRERLKGLMDTIENLDDSVIDEVAEFIQPTNTEGKKSAPDIHSVLDKIQSSIPSVREVQKFFVKDGKILK